LEFLISFSFCIPFGAFSSRRIAYGFIEGTQFGQFESSFKAILKAFIEALLEDLFPAIGNAICIAYLDRERVFRSRVYSAM